MSSSKKRIDLSLADKVKLLKHLQLPGVSQASAAKKFGVSTSQVSRLVKAKQQIFDQFDTGNHNRKRQRAGKEEEVGSALFLWFQQKLSQGARLSGPLLKQKATELAAAEGTEFTPSDGWLSRWKSRHNIAYKKEQGEKQNADFPAAQQWKQHIVPAILQAYNRDDIFNADETGLYYRGLPDRGHCIRGDELLGGKKAMERITTLVCANMSGTEKRPLFIIGKSRQPRCFPRDPSRIPVDYGHSKNAWMTGEWFTKWLNKWDAELRCKRRRICLLVDNCSAHPSKIALTNIELKFLPPNTTSLIQPLDMGVIKNWKGHYRSRLNSRVIAALDADPDRRAVDVAKTFNVLDAIYLAKESWDAVKPQTLVGCFRKAGLSDSETTDDPVDVDPLADVPTPENMTSEEFNEYIEMDNAIEVTGELSDVELLESVREAKRSRLEDRDSDSDTENEPPPLTVKQQMDMVDYLRRFTQRKGMISALPMLRQIENAVYADVAEAKKQRTIVSFFS